MDQLLNLFGFLSVLLRAVTLATQTLAVGGVVFMLAVAKPLRLTEGPGANAMLGSWKRLIVL
ncbi:MAG TPA: hypothetical protein VFB82_25115, partial [Blastocatellia bacterium]|nr:hypothetical protein [Blastocatellia bacterium]